MYTSEGCSVTHVLSGGWQRKAGSQPCMQWGTLSDTCPQWGMGEERRISHVRSEGRSVTHVPSGGWGRRGSQSCTQ